MARLFACALVLATGGSATGCSASHGALDGSVMDAAVDSGAVDSGAADSPAADSGVAEDPACLPRTTPAELEAFLQAAVRAQCEHDIACGTGLFDWASVDDCVRYDVVARLNVVGWNTRGVRDGVVALDPVAAEGCLDALRSCDPAPSRYARVDRLHHARRATPETTCREAIRLRCPGPGPGEPCAPTASWRACGADAWCDLYTDRCHPTCVARGAPGTACDGEDECAVDPSAAWIWCDDPDLELDAGGECVPLDEGPPAAAGEACGRVETDGVARLVRCAAPAVCEDLTDPETARCVGPALDGEPCSLEPWARVRCLPGSFCDARTCTPRDGSHRPVRMGEPCDPHGPCDEQYRTRCVDGVCVEAGRATGQPCDVERWDPYDDIPLCDLGLTCIGPYDAGRCFPPRPVGARCDPDSHYNPCDGCCIEGRCVSRQECRYGC